MKPTITVVDDNLIVTGVTASYVVEPTSADKYADHWDDWEPPTNRGEETQLDSDLIGLITEGLRDDNQAAIDCAFDKIREWYIGRK